MGLKTNRAATPKCPAMDVPKNEPMRMAGRLIIAKHRIVAGKSNRGNLYSPLATAIKSFHGARVTRHTSFHVNTRIPRKPISTSWFSMCASTIESPPDWGNRRDEPANGKIAKLTAAETPAVQGFDQACCCHANWHKKDKATEPLWRRRRQQNA